MTLRHRHPDTHAYFRALISQRLDERLSTEEARALRAHLLTCARCRAADRDYRAQRTLLRGPAQAVPPRDLWARTSAALDREVARSGRSGVTREPFELRRRGTPRAAIASLVGMALVVAVVGNQMGSDVATVVTPSGIAGRVAPTPFEVPTQELAYVGNDAAGLAIYRTSVSLVCPERAIDCASVGAGDREVIRLSQKDNVKPNSVAFHPQHDKVAIAASDGRGESVYVVLLKPVPRSLDAEETDAPRAPTDAPRAPTDAPRAPTDAPWTPTDTPAAVATASLTATDVRPPSGSTVTDAPEPTGTASGNGNGSPTTTAPSSQETGGNPEPTATARASRSPRTTNDPSTSTPTDVPTPKATAPPTVAVTPEPPVSSVTPTGELHADTQPILQDVLPTGAEPAWSPDGETLAFSAMPADGSHGPDIYIWQTGSDKAKRLTSDHRSYFASWAGSRIVASRAARPTTTGENREPGLRVSTVVIDLRTGEQRRIDVRGLWLPVVDATERFAVVWRGELREVGPALEPVAGVLYLADWRRLDPFRVTASGPVSRIGEGARPRNLDSRPTATPAAAATPAASPPDKSAAGGSPRPAGETRVTGRRRTRAPGTPTTTPVTTPARSVDLTPSATSEPTIRPTPTEDPTAGAQAIEPGRDPRLDPVLDWQVRWNTDGDAYGFWVAETPGASWGRLVVVGVDRSSGRIERDATLLGPTLARRTFTVGNDRVAWVAPADDDADGELRVRTWGPNGNGTVRIRDLDGEGVPGF